MILQLRGYENGDEMLQYFTLNEKDTALHIARLWDMRGWQPYLLQKTYDGKFSVLYSNKQYRKVA